MAVRALVLATLAVAAGLALAGCGDEREERDERATRRLELPPATSNGAVGAQLLRLERDDDWISARVRLENTGTEAVQLRNLGDTLTGFRAVVGERSFSAEARGKREEPITAARLTELPAQTPVELDLRWRIWPPQRGDYAVTIVVGNLFAASGEKLPDLPIVVPGAGDDAPARGAGSQVSL